MAAFEERPLAIDSSRDDVVAHFFE
jgi:hypothetical protein